MKIFYFSSARIAAGCDEDEVSIDGSASIEEVWNALTDRHPDLAAIRAGARLSRNDEYADDATVFHDDDIVAVIPPVSGG